jgi:predicted esterase
MVAVVAAIALAGSRAAEAATATPTGTSAIPTAGLQLWLKADAGVTKDAGNVVSAWADQSGNKMDATSPSPSARPLFVAHAVHGKPAMRFDGLQGHFTLPAGFADFTAGASVFVVARPTAVKKYARLFELANNGANQIGFTRVLTSQAVSFGVHETGWGGAMAANALMQNAWQLQEGALTPQGDASVYTNGIYLVTRKTDIPSNIVRSTNYIGWSSGMSAGDEAYQGDIAEIIIYNTVLSPDDRQQVERYLLQRYAIPHKAAATPAEQMVFKTARAVPTQYFLSLPHGWRPDRSWPILVTIDGSGHTFADNCTGFTAARNTRPYIIVTPCVSSNGRDPADKAAVLEIVREVQQDYHGQAKFFLDGFSAGGSDTWQIIAEHPELLAGAVLSSGVFGWGQLNVSTTADHAQLPIHAVTGEHDMPGIDKMWASALQFAHDNGYLNISGEIVPGGGHNAYPDQVLAFCDRVRAR